MTPTARTYHPHLNADEQELSDCVAAGRTYEGTGRPGIRVALVRDLLLGDAAPRGVSIKGVTIEGVLDIRDARGMTGGGCNALILDDCVLQGGGPDEPAIDARNSRLTRLSLTGCYAQGIDLSSAEVMGDIGIVGLMPRADLSTDGRLDRDACWIIARGLRVEGALTVSHSTLKLPWRAGSPWPPEVRRHWPDMPQPFALDLRDAKTAGSLHLRPGFVSTGGISVGGATIGGEFWAAGAKLRASGLQPKGVDALALFGQGVEVHGSVLLQHDAQAGRRFEAEGPIDISWAHIGGSLSLRGAKLTSTDPQPQAPLSLLSSTVSGDLMLDAWSAEEQNDEIRFEVDGTLQLTNATIRGMSRIACPHGMDASNATFGNALDLVAGEKVTISGALVTSNLNLGTPDRIEPAARGFDRIRPPMEETLDQVNQLDDQVVAVGADHEDIMATRYWMTYWLAMAGQVTAAIDELRAVRDDRIRVLGADDRDTLATRHSLGYWLGKAGSFDAAIDELRAVRDDRIRVLGADHPDTLETRYSLAYWLGEAGAADAAIAELRALRDDQIRVLSADDRDTLETRRSLAYWLGIEELDASALRVDGTLTFVGRLTGKADLDGSLIKGDLALGVSDSERLETLSLASVDGRSPILSIAGARVDGALSVALVPIPARWVVADKPRIRAAPLRVYRGEWLLAEALFRPETGSEVAILAFLYRPTDGSIMVLDGLSDAIHELNSRVRPSLNSKEQVREYLSLFCNYVWGDEGSFRIVPPDSVHQDAPIITVADGPGSDGGWTASATILYGSGEFEASFRIEGSGEVTMTDDRPIRADADHQAIRYETPYRRVPGQDDWPLPLPEGIELKDFDGPKLERIQDALEGKLGTGGQEREGPRIQVDLSGAKVGRLADYDGSRWFVTPPGTPLVDEAGATNTRVPSWIRPATKWLAPKPKRSRSPIRLVLNGLDYDRTVAADGKMDIKQRLARRTTWLFAQYDDPDKVTTLDFVPQPFAQLARVFRAEGNYGAADDITFEKLRLERMARNKRFIDGTLRRRALQIGIIIGLVALLGISNDAARSFLFVVLIASVLLLFSTKTLMYWFVERPFGYGLRTKNAIATVGIFWLAGMVFVLAGLSGLGFMKVDASSVSTVATGESTTIVPTGDFAGVPEVNCSSHIDPGLYALDVMVPLLDLRQEQRCTVSAIEGSWFWIPRLLKVAYAVLGWIVVSGLVLTASGVVRRQVEK